MVHSALKTKGVVSWPPPAILAKSHQVVLLRPGASPPYQLNKRRGVRHNSGRLEIPRPFVRCLAPGSARWYFPLPLPGHADFHFPRFPPPRRHVPLAQPYDDLVSRLAGGSEHASARGGGERDELRRLRESRFTSTFVYPLPGEAERVAIRRRRSSSFSDGRGEVLGLTDSCRGGMSFLVFGGLVVGEKSCGGIGDGGTVAPDAYSLPSRAWGNNALVKLCE